MNRPYLGDFKNTFLFITVLFGPALAIQSRSVNLAVETSFLFDPKDIKENATFINNVQEVIDKLKSVLTPNTPVFRHTEVAEKTVLTKFMAEIGSSLIQFDNKDLTKLTSDLNDVVQKYAKDNDDFNEMIEDKALRAFIKNTVKEWAVTDPMVLKVEIAKYITNIDSNSIINFIKILNKFFDSADEVKFKKLLKKFAKAKKNKDFSKFLSKTINFVLFKRYKKLNYLLKVILKEELKKFTDYVTKNYEYRIRDDSNIEDSKNDNNNIATKPINQRLSLPNLGRANEMSKSDKESQQDTSDSEEQNPKNARKTDHLYIDKDLNMDVRSNDKFISMNMHSS